MIKQHLINTTMFKQILSNIVDRVEMSIKNLRNLRGKHDQWSLKDVPIQLLRKPLNFGMQQGNKALFKSKLINLLNYNKF